MKRVSQLAIPQISQADLEVINPKLAESHVSSSKAKLAKTYQPADVKKDLRNLGVAGTAALKISSFENEEDLAYLWDTEDELREEITKTIESFKTAEKDYFMDWEKDTKASISALASRWKEAASRIAYFQQQKALASKFSSELQTGLTAVRCIRFALRIIIGRHARFNSQWR